MRGSTNKNRRKARRVAEGSIKVFADLGLPNPEQELVKAQLTLQIYSILRDSGMRQAEIAKVLSVRQSQVSLLMRNRSGNFSVGKLMGFLTALRRDVEIVVRPAKKQHGTVSVSSARSTRPIGRHLLSAR